MAVKKNWLGSEVGLELKTVTVPANYNTNASTNIVTVNGRKIVKAGALITDSVLGSGLLWNDVDITDGARVASMMIRGVYINANLPTAIPTTGAVNIGTLAQQGLYSITFPATVIPYGEVSD